MNIGVFFGGKSTEHDVSIITGQLIIDGLRKLGRSVTPVYLSRKGEWLIDDSLGKLGVFTDPAKDSTKDRRYQQYLLDLEISHGKMVFRKKGLAGRALEIDMAFPAFHGSYGEDGTMQGLFEMFDIPYVGCGVAASAIAMDKALTKQICIANSVPTVPFHVFTKSEWKKDKNSIIERISKLSWPVFVKPVHLGSSIGIAKVEDKKDLEDKIEVALFYDDKVLVEEGVQNLKDLTCCIIGNDDLIASEVQESAFSAELFDFEEKYLKDGGAQLGKAENNLIIPANIEGKIADDIKNMAKKVYAGLGCAGIARVDFLMDSKSGKYWTNEVNPLPGTLYHHLWKASGIEFAELLTKLLQYAKISHDAKTDLTHSFSSNLLTNLNSQKMGTKIRD